MLLVAMSCGCNQAHSYEQPSTSAFRYREVYLPEAIGEAANSLGLNTLDEDWGIWGHNIGKVLPEKPSESVYAKVNGNTIKSQFCFTSNRLYEYICDYIDDHYRGDEQVRFAIIPNDNDVVCLCVRCIDAGNTKVDASPAVFSLIRRLAEKYPHHIFYTSDYRTTRRLPEEDMPENTGVMVSAMPYPFTYGNTPEEQSFMNTLSGWSAKTNKILVWDYINNFDDYFTPYPIFGVMQNRLKNYRDHKVTAVFLNGSGTEASSFSRLKSVVLAALTENPDVDWRELLMSKAKEMYPVSGETVANFILAQEDYVKDTGASLPLYEGVPVAKQTYLPEELFSDFFNKLSRLRLMTTGEERKSLDKLLAELAMTQLELKRINGDLSGSESLLEQLESLQEMNIESYSESGWRIDNYINDYHFILQHEKETGGKNRLKDTQLVAMTPLDPDYSDVSVLTDGVLAIPSNYHNGHLITSPEDFTSLAIPYKEGAKKLVVWLTYNPAYRIYLPEGVTLSAQGMEKVFKTVEYPKERNGHCRLEFDLPSNINGTMILNLYKDPETKSMAIEEIELI